MFWKRRMGFHSVRILLCIGLMVTICIKSDECLIRPSPKDGVLRANCSLTHRGYLKSRIPYYSNSIACFNVEIMCCGDVNPNPGPLESQQCVNLNKVITDKLSYSSSTLLSIRDYGHVPKRLPAPVWKNIIDLGIASKHPTHRGVRSGKQKQRRIPVLCSTGRNQNTYQQTGANITNLITIKTNKWNMPTLMNTNARSLIPKLDELSVILLDKNVDVCCITET